VQKKWGVDCVCVEPVQVLRCVRFNFVVLQIPNKGQNINKHAPNSDLDACDWPRIPSRDLCGGMNSHFICKDNVHVLHRSRESGVGRDVGE